MDIVSTLSYEYCCRGQSVIDLNENTEYTNFEGICENVVFVANYLRIDHVSFVVNSSWAVK